MMIVESVGRERLTFTKVGHLGVDILEAPNSEHVTAKQPAQCPLPALSPASTATFAILILSNTSSYHNGRDFASTDGRPAEGKTERTQEAERRRGGGNQRRREDQVSVGWSRLYVS